MFLTFLYLIAVGVMIYFAVRKGIDRSIIHHKVSAILFWIALTILTLYGAFFLAFGIGEMSGGDISGACTWLPRYSFIYWSICAGEDPLRVGSHYWSLL